MKFMRKKTIFDKLYEDKIRNTRGKINIDDYYNDFLMFDRRIK